MATVGERVLGVSAAEGSETKKVPGRTRGRAGMHVPRVFSTEGIEPVRSGRLGPADRGDQG